MKKLAVVCGILFLTGCEKKTELQKKIRVVCTTSMLADMAREIGGEMVETCALMGPGIDPHVYRARAGDVDTLSHADIIFFNGLHLEGKMGDLLAHIGERIPSFALAETLPQSLLRASNFAGLYDPHVWHDVSLWKQIVPRMSKELSSLDPEHASYFEENGLRYSAELTALDDWIKKKFLAVPKKKRILVTAHDAFAYFGAAYGFTVVGLQGISTDAEIGIRDVQELVSFIVENKIPVIFVESSIPQRSIRAVQEAVRASGWQVSIGDELFSDALGDASTGGETYIKMIQHNVTAMVDGLLNGYKRES